MKHYIIFAAFAAAFLGTGCRSSVKETVRRHEKEVTTDEQGIPPTWDPRTASKTVDSEETKMRAEIARLEQALAVAEARENRKSYQKSVMTDETEAKLSALRARVAELEGERNSRQTREYDLEEERTVERRGWPISVGRGSICDEPSFGIRIRFGGYHGDHCACTRCYEYRTNRRGLFTRPPYGGDNGYSRQWVRANGPYTPDGRPLGGRRDPDGVIRYYPTDSRGGN